MQNKQLMIMEKVGNFPGIQKITGIVNMNYDYFRTSQGPRIGQATNEFNKYSALVKHKSDEAMSM